MKSVPVRSEIGEAAWAAAADAAQRAVDVLRLRAADVNSLSMLMIAESLARRGAEALGIFANPFTREAWLRQCGIVFDMHEAALAAERACQAKEKS